MTDLLEDTPLLAGIGPAALDDLRGAAEPFRIEAGTLLFRQGDPPTGLYVVESGALEIATRMPGDDAAAISRISPREVVGEFALLDDSPRSANVRALEPSSGLLIGARAFAALLAEGRAGALATIDRLRALVAGRTRATLDRIAARASVESSELRRLPGDAPAVPAEADAAKLRGVPGLAALDAAPAAQLIAAGEPFTLTREARLARAGDPPKSVALVLRGALRASFERREGLEQVAVHGPGDWAGLIAMVDGGPQPLALSAAEDTLALRIDCAGFDRWRNETSPLAQALMASVNRQLIRDQRRANRHLGRSIAQSRFNAARELA